MVREMREIKMLERDETEGHVLMGCVEGRDA